MDKKRSYKRIVSWVMAIAMLIGCVGMNAQSVYAAGYLDDVQNLSLNTLVTGTLDNSDYYGNTQYNVEMYWDVYKFTMPSDGNLMCYMESATNNYFNNGYYLNKGGGPIAIYSASSPDTALWDAPTGLLINSTFSSARGVYYGSKQVFLSAGTYYFAVRNTGTQTSSYSLKLSLGVTSITLSPTESTLEVGQTVQLSAAVSPSGAADKTLTWKSDDTSVAAVSESGLVTALSVGTAKITATDVSGEVSASCEITVVQNISGAVISGLPTDYYYDGEEKKPDPTVTLNGKTLGSDDYTVSYANNINAGTATVTVTGKGNYTGSVSAAFNIAKVSNSLSTSYSSVTAYKNYLTRKTKYFINGSGDGKITYTLNKKAKKAKIKISKSGKLVIPKRCKRGTYKLTVKAAGDINHYSMKKVIKIYIR